MNEECKQIQVLNSQSPMSIAKHKLILSIKISNHEQRIPLSLPLYKTQRDHPTKPKYIIRSYNKLVGSGWMPRKSHINLFSSYMIHVTQISFKRERERRADLAWWKWESVRRQRGGYPFPTRAGRAEQSKST